MRPKSAGILIIATALFAGCIGEPATFDYEDPTYAAEEPLPPAEPEAESDPIGSAEDEPSVERGAQASAAGAVTMPLSMTGHTGTTLCYRGALGSYCRALSEDYNNVLYLDMPEKPGFLNGTLTWDASTPATDYLAAYLIVDRGDGYWFRYGIEPLISGTSPLEVSFDLAEFEGNGVALGIDNNGCAGYALLTCTLNYGLHQDFTFEGELTGWN